MRINRNAINQTENSTNNQDCGTSFTKFPIYYNSFEKFDCNETILNDSLLKCIDTLLEWKLGKKLSSQYDTQLQPVFIFKHKMNCIPAYSDSFPKKFKCNLITKTLINKKKIVWKLIFKLKNESCVRWKSIGF